MKHPFRRSMSMMLVLAIFVSLLSGLTIQVHAATYSYNTGVRGQTATSLTSSAAAFYSKNGISYNTLSALDGSSTLSAVPDSDLYEALHDLMASNHTHETSYSETRGLYKYTDCQGGNRTAISSFYSGVSIGPEWDGGSTWNREHTWPNSKSPTGPSENDIMMLRPTAMTENSSRGNRAYGVSSGFYHPNSESNGKYDLRGDVARIMLYVYTRWGGPLTSNMWGSAGVIESKAVLLDWIKADPVDTWELGRNDVVEEITHTRNVFVDYPELAFLLFNEAIPANMPTPSGNAGRSYTITVTVNDSSMGSATISGKNINASPAEGYLVEGYTLISGSATVIRNGNSFIVDAASDCIIQINFAPRATATVTYKNLGSTISATTVYAGDTVTLPEYTGTAPQDYTFLGWSDATVSHSDRVPTYYKTGASYTVNRDVTLHALFSYSAKGSSNTGIWTLVTDASMLEAGNQVVLAANSKGVVAGSLGNSVLSRVNAAFSADKTTIPTLPDGAMIFTLGGSDGAWTLADPDGNLLGATAVKNLSFSSGTTKWSISISGSDATIQNGTSSYGRILYNSGSPRFTTYTSNVTASMLLPQIYMMNAGSTTYYTTEACLHEHTQTIPAQPATCTEAGYTAGVYCCDCDTYISGHGVIPALGHDYVGVVTPPTKTEPGYTTYTCSRCCDSYIGDEVPPLGETYIVTFCVPEGVDAVAAMECNSSGITLPVAGVPQTHYKFLGWTGAQVIDSQTKPDYFEGGSTYVATSDITLYALYCYAEGGTGELRYLLVENTSQLRVGAKVVVAAVDYDLALSTTQNENNRTPAAITKNADKTITFGADTAVLTLGEGIVDNTWSLHCAVNGGYLYAASSYSNHLKTQSTLTANSSFSITLGSNGSATVVAQGDKTNNRLRYNSTNNIFSCYPSGHKDICFYVETRDGTLLYTTGAGVPLHVHSGVYQKAIPATCTSAGTIAHYLCACGKTFADSACTRELTDIVDPQKAHSYTAQAAEPEYLKTKADCQNAAVYYLSCVFCGASSKGTNSEGVFQYGSPDPTAHSLTAVEEIPATHEKTGVAAHYKCSVCQKLFSDAQGTQEITAAGLILEIIPHSYGKYKYSSSQHWKECSCGNIKYRFIHTYGKWKIVKKTTTQVTKQRSCTLCGYAQTISIPAIITPAYRNSFQYRLYLLLMCSSGGTLLLPFLQNGK